MTQYNDFWLNRANERRKQETHPYLKKVFIPEKRIEQVCNEALARHKLMPDSPRPIRVERLLEKEWGISEEYEDLPQGVLGAAGFGSRGLEKVVISKQFGDPVDSTAEKRSRSTIAHEIGHGLLHEKHWIEFFRREQEPDLFNPEPEAPSCALQEMCRESIITATNMGQTFFQWWEYQANLGMSNLLVPTPLLRKALDRFRLDFVSEQRRNGLSTEVPVSGVEVARELADTFMVSSTLMRLRLSGFKEIQNYNIVL